jgi:hypothetical protein
MKIYQCIHLYPAYATELDQKLSLIDPTELSFEKVLNLLIEDGFYESYILTPPADSDYEVFFTFWNYPPLQRLWAIEHGMPEDARLSQIRIAQVKAYQPDIVFDFSPFKDFNFIDLLHQHYAELNKEASFLCWNAYIKEEVMTFPKYHAHVTLHQPYIEHWQNIGLKAFELQPGIPPHWPKTDVQERHIDVLFYGQYLDNVFKNRRGFVNQLLELKASSGLTIDVHLQIAENADTSPIQSHLHLLKPPIFANQLYNKIRAAKIVVNNYTDYNGDYKSNARVFEALGNGALLISEAGIYPQGLIAGEDFLTYNSITELPELLSRVLNNWEQYKMIAQNGRYKVNQLYSQLSRWKKFEQMIVANNLRPEI